MADFGPENASWGPSRRGLPAAGLSAAARTPCIPADFRPGSAVTPARIAPMKAHAGPVPALPPVPYAPSRPMAIVQHVYEFAARHPEVLQYVPCYCGCERMSHNGNHDCFVKARKANGTVTEWEPHGIGCAICLDVGRDAMTFSIQARRSRRFARRSSASTCRISHRLRRHPNLKLSGGGERRL